MSIYVCLKEEIKRNNDKERGIYAQKELTTK